MHSKNNVSAPVINSEKTSKVRRTKFKKIIYILISLLIIGLTPLVYRYIAKADAYNQAGIKLNNGQFDEAKQAYLSMNHYMDSETLALECDYQAALSGLSKNYFTSAKNVFISLGDYKDSADLAKECDYQQGMQLKESYYYYDAFKLFNQLGSYKDSPAITEQLKAYAYEKAVTMYRNSQLIDAKSLFIEIGDYIRSKDYIFLIDIRMLNIPASKTTAQTLIGMINFADAKEILGRDAFLGYYLEGRWETDKYSGNYYITFTSDSSFSTNIPELRFISNRPIHTLSELEIYDENSIIVILFTDKKYYLERK